MENWYPEIRDEKPATSSRSSPPPTTTPSKDWLKIVKMYPGTEQNPRLDKDRRTKTEYRDWTRDLRKDFRRYSLSFGKLQKNGELKRVAVEFGFVAEDDLMAAVGYGKLSCNKILGKLLSEEKLAETREQKESRVSKVLDKLTKKSTSAIQINGVDDVLVRFGKCCNPVPGDDIVGFITRGGGSPCTPPIVRSRWKATRNDASP
jgi:GTP pyrophosphokinase